MKACFMGLGYIGLPTAIIAAKHGIEVTGVDINPSVVELTNRGTLRPLLKGITNPIFLTWKRPPVPCCPC